MYIIIANDDPFGNHFRVSDQNAGGATVFDGYIDAHGQVGINIVENDSGYGNIVTYQDGNSGIGRSFLHDGDHVSL